MVVTPDNKAKFDSSIPSVFLAGTIDDGKSEDWQAKCIIHLESVFDDICIVNPRRSQWVSMDDNTIQNPELVSQIKFEISNFMRTDTVLLWLEPDSKSPISLLELGILCCDDAERLREGLPPRLVVYCPHEFYRSANVWTTVETFVGLDNIFDNSADAVSAVTTLLKNSW